MKTAIKFPVVNVNVLSAQRSFVHGASQSIVFSVCAFYAFGFCTRTPPKSHFHFGTKNKATRMCFPINRLSMRRWDEESATKITHKHRQASAKLHHDVGWTFRSYQIDFVGERRRVWRRYAFETNRSEKFAQFNQSKSFLWRSHSVLNKKTWCCCRFRSLPSHCPSKSFLLREFIFLSFLSERRLSRHTIFRAPFSRRENCKQKTTFGVVVASVVDSVSMIWCGWTFFGGGRRK